MSGRAKSAKEYASLVDQVIAELQDVLDAARFDFDEVESNTDHVEVLLKEMRDLRASMADGSYQFGRNDLPFMRIVKAHNDSDLPFIRLFYDINQTHRQGLDIGES
ncbi:MAG: general secretion pathway protein GspF [Gammaproteobacteria bacterium]|jgi:uncharacterized coiled-coil protein SlyX|nr:general secretion pathway protein GspF [Gammaproteobacteria bacterium]